MGQRHAGGELGILTQGVPLHKEKQCLCVSPLVLKNNQAKERFLMIRTSKYTDVASMGHLNLKKLAGALSLNLFFHLILMLQAEFVVSNQNLSDTYWSHINNFKNSFPPNILSKKTLNVKKLINKDFGYCFANFYFFTH